MSTVVRSCQWQAPDTGMHGTRAFGHFVAHADADGGPGTAALKLQRETRTRHSCSMHQQGTGALAHPAQDRKSARLTRYVLVGHRAGRRASGSPGFRLSILRTPTDNRVRCTDGVDPSCVGPASRQPPAACNIDSRVQCERARSDSSGLGAKQRRARRQHVRIFSFRLQPAGTRPHRAPSTEQRAR